MEECTWCLVELPTDWPYPLCAECRSEDTDTVSDETSDPWDSTVEDYDRRGDR